MKQEVLIIDNAHGKALKEQLETLINEEKAIIEQVIKTSKTTYLLIIKK